MRQVTLSPSLSLSLSHTFFSLFSITHTFYCLSLSYAQTHRNTHTYILFSSLYHTHISISLTLSLSTHTHSHTFSLLFSYFLSLLFFHIILIVARIWFDKNRKFYSFHHLFHSLPFVFGFIGELLLTHSLYLFSLF